MTYIHIAFGVAILYRIDTIFIGRSGTAVYMLKAVRGPALTMFLTEPEFREFCYPVQVDGGVEYACKPDSNYYGTSGDT